jgi:SSS family solute:Na+ symporter
MLSFFIFVLLAVSAVLISLFDKAPTVYVAEQSEIHNTSKPTRRVKIAWALLTIVMIALYFIFNGH